MNNEELADILINTFCGIWLSLRSTTSAEDLQMYKVQLMKALVSQGLNNEESISIGVNAIRVKGGQYPPSVPEFVKLCGRSQSCITADQQWQLEKINHVLTDEQVQCGSEAMKKLRREMQ